MSVNETIKPTRALAAWRRCRRGSAATEFALILPALLLLTLGALEGGLIMFDFHKVSEATRRGLRAALIEDAIIDLGDLDTTPITCTGSGSVSCSGGSVDNSGSFDTIVAAMQEVSPRIDGDNVIVTYSDSGLDIGGTGLTVTPLVTVEVTGLSYEFVAMTYIPGLPDELNLPSFDTTRLAHTTVPDS